MANNKKTYSNVSELLRGTASSDDSLADEFEELQNQREIIKQLITLRVKKNLSQNDIAEAMGCSQSCVSKLEGDIDDNLKLGELRKYLHALGMEPCVGALKQGRTIVDEVKLLVSSIKSRLDKLAEIAHDDDSLAQGIAKFYGEAFYNFTKILANSAANLPDRPDGNGPYIQFGFVDETPMQEITCTEIRQVSLEKRITTNKRSRHLLR